VRGPIQGSSLMFCEMCILLSPYTVFKKVAAVTSRKGNTESIVLDNFVNHAIICTTWLRVGFETKEVSSPWRFPLFLFFKLQHCDVFINSGIFVLFLIDLGWVASGLVQEIKIKPPLRGNLRYPPGKITRYRGVLGQIRLKLWVQEKNSRKCETLLHWNTVGSLASNSGKCDLVESNTDTLFKTANLEDFLLKRNFGLRSLESPYL
jgi:hypothetical protein